MAGNQAREKDDHGGALGVIERLLFRVIFVMAAPVLAYALWLFMLRDGWFMGCGSC